MKTIGQVRNQLSGGDFEFSRHALKRAVERNIGEQEIRQAGMTATIIEEYPEDKYSPNCLLLGYTEAGRPLHIQVSLADRDPVRIITLYEPLAEEWIEHSRRRR